jgi:ketosteroid isomerase-like protein
MFLSNLPQPIEAFLKATREHDAEGLLATLSDDAVLTDMGEDRSGDRIRAWNDELYLGANVEVHPIHVDDRDGHIVLAVAVDGDYGAYGVTEPFQLDWHVTLKGDRISALRMVEVKLDLPEPIVAFVKAMNMYDGDAMLAAFAEGAVVNDQQCQHLGKDAIRRWADKEIIGDRVTMYVTDALAHPGGHAVTAKVTGTYDKTGLPDPLVLRFYFSLGEGGITQLVVVPVKSIAG